MRAAFVGALVGAGLFAASAMVGGFGPCTPETAWGPAVELANAPAKLVAEVWTDGPVRPQQTGRECWGTFLRRWNRRAFALTGACFYGLFGAIAGWVARWRFGD